MSALMLRPVLASTARYAPPRHPAPCNLDLSGTELPPLDAEQLAEDLASASSQGYPSTAALQDFLGAAHGVQASQVLITAGSDDALERACRIVLEPGRAALITAPTFEMLPRWIRLTGAACREVPWPREEFPVEDLLRDVDESTALIAVVTPNNPTGAVATVESLVALAQGAPRALVLVDLAYVEFAEVDPTPDLLQLPNVVVTRTLSKAWGLPALRLGYALGNDTVIAAMQRVAPPYPASMPAITAALCALPRDRAKMLGRVSSIRTVRRELTAALEDADLQPIASHANFVATTAPRAAWLRDGLAGLGVAVRSLDRPEATCIRISCPTEGANVQRLIDAIATVTGPQALLFDLDGVIADVSESYRAAILDTAGRFGASLTARDVQERKAAGNANDDWALTHELLALRGIDAELSVVTATFEALYQGTSSEPGLHARERMIPSATWLRELSARWPLAIVTGRPRADAERFLCEHRIAECFRVVVCREDAPIKPDPAPVLRALSLLGVTRAWMVGDTPDDIRAARAAGVVPIGIPAPGESSSAAVSLSRAGAARVLNTLEELYLCLP